MSFAILFSLRVINQLQAHPDAAQPEVHTRAHSHPHLETQSRSCLPFPWGGRRHCLGKTPAPNGCLAFQGPRAIQNQELKAGRQDVPVVGETGCSMSH